jgi:radical SAM protein with 4Fe4S-binding SPASM domain
MGIGFKKYTLLRYKPPGDIKRWIQEKPDKRDLILLEVKLISLQKKYPDAVFRIDCAFSFLERRLNPQTALLSGIKGCTAFDRIMAVAPDGSVYPCSQLVGRKFRAGNLLNEVFDSIWHENELAEKYRNFRNFQSFRAGVCGKCTAKAFCGGCRVFAGDDIDSDPGCPEPIYRNKKKIGH